MKKLYIYLSPIVAFIFFSIFAHAQVLNVTGVPTSLCANEKLTIDYTSIGFNAVAGNEFIADLSDGSGNFAIPIFLGSVSSLDPSGTINIQIPAGTVFNTGYRIRVTSTLNDTAIPVTGENGVDIDINCTTKDYFWVNGAGNWSDLNHWEYTIDGGSTFISPADVLPTQHDNVDFDENSFPSGGTLNVDMNVDCNDMYWSSNVTTGPQLYAPPGYTINIYGDLVMANGVYRDVDRFEFRSPSNHAIIDLADNTLKLNSTIYWGDGYFNFYGSSSWELESDVVAEGIRLYDNTILTSNNHDLDLAYSLYLGAGTFNAGSSNISSYRLEDYGTFNAETSTLIFDKGNGFITGGTVINKVVFESGDFEIFDTNTFNSLILEEDVKIKLPDGLTQTVINEFQALGTRAKMIDIQSLTAGVTATLDLGSSSIVVNFVILQDNTVNASTVPVIASNSINNGNNFNWTIASIASLNYFWVGGSGNWSDVSHWATTDNGAIFRTDPPGPKDNVNFTTSSFPSSGKITLDISADCNNMIWTDGTTNPTISSIESNPLTIRGNFQLVAGVTRDIDDLRFESVASNTLIFADNTVYTTGSITFDGTGSWSLQDQVSTNDLEVNGGTFNSNDKTLTINNALWTSGGTTNLFNSDVYARYLFGVPANLNANLSTIYLTDNGYISGDYILHNVILDERYTFYGNNTFENIIINEGAEINFSNGLTQTFNQSLTINGTRNEMVTISSDNPGNQAFLVTANASAIYDINYAKIQDVSLDNASGFTTFEIANNSEDQGGNTGWDFTSNPLVPLDYYWVGGAGDWSDADNHWSSIDGGFANLTEPPGSFDNVFFTGSSSFAVDDTVTLDIPASVHTMTWQDGSATPVIYDGKDFNPLTLSGSLFMVNGVKRSINTINFNSADITNLIQIAGNEGELGNINFEGGGTWTMLDSLAVINLTINSGKLVTNSNELYVLSFLQSNDQIDFGNSKINVFYYYGNAPASVGGETIYIEQGGFLSTFGGFLNNVIFEGDGTIDNTNNVNNLTAEVAGSTLTFQGGNTTTINNNLTLTGTSGSLINIISNNAGVQSNISMPGSATVSADYVSITDNNGLGGASFSTTNSALFSNVSGWTGLTGQTITMTTVDVPFTDGTVTLNATTDSGLGLVYNLTQGDASIAGNILTPNNPGLVGIEVSQAGDATYAEAKIERYIHFNNTNQSNELGNFKEATYVVGQKDFVSNESFFDVNKTPHARKALVTKDGKLISSGRRRVLIWNQVPGAADVPADIVLGQPDFISSDFEINSSTIYSAAYSIAVADDGRLLVADSRGIMIWNSIPTVNGTPADVIIGQEDFNSFEQGAFPNRFNSAVFFILTPDQKLIVSDLLGNRVLIFNQIPTVNGASADLVIGQTDFTSISAGLGPEKLDFPGYPTLSSDGKLFIPDANNNRVLAFNSVPTVSGTSADYVLGQVDLNSNVEGLGTTGLDYPYSVDISRTGKMAIADRQNDRVLIYNSVPMNNITDPDYVLGQPDFDTEGDNTGGLSGRSIQDAYAVYWDVSDNLYVGDLQNNRFLVWGLPDFSPPLDFTTGNTIAVGESVVDGYWNSTNTSIDITVPIADDESLNAGNIQMQIKFGSGNFNDIGSLVAILGSNLGTTQIVHIDAALLQASVEFVEEASFVFRAIIYDAANNQTIGTESASSLIIDTVAPTLNAGGTTLPTTYEVGSAIQPNISANPDDSGIKEIVFNYNLISSMLLDAYNQVVLTLDQNGTAIADLQAAIQSSSEQIGLKYYIDITDNAGNIFTTIDNEQIINLKYPDGISISGFGIGTTTEAYRLMAIPLELSNAAVEHVFGDIFGGSYDNTKMRVFSYPGGNATEFAEATGSTDLKVGKGYFSLAAESASITSPDGVTSFEPIQNSDGDDEQGFIINLVNGWNLIGNPFLHDVKWSDIIELSGITNEVDNLQVYKNGSYSNVTLIGVGEGAFVNSNGAFTLKIPTRVNIGGRISRSEPNTNELTEDSWEVILKSPSSIGEEIILGGIGMEKEALLSKDQFDWLNPPAFATMKLIDFNHPEFMVSSFKKDVRETALEEKWSFNYKVETPSGEEHTISWDNSYFGDNSPDLYLVDKTHFATINMKDVSSYTFSHTNTTSFEVYFGYNVLEQIVPDGLINQSPFPNPFSNEITFNLGLPQDGTYLVEIRIFDSVGKVIRSIFEGNIDSGYNSIIWDGQNEYGQILPNGIYLYSIHIKGLSIDFNESGKILKR